MTTRFVRRSILGPLLVLLAAGPLCAQPMARRVATIAAIRNHPTFYHGQTVVVRGALGEGQPPALTSSDSTIRLLLRESPPGAGAYEIRPLRVFKPGGALEPL